MCFFISAILKITFSIFEALIIFSMTVLPGVNVVVVIVDPLPPEGNSTDVGRVVIGLVVVGCDVVGRVVGLYVGLVPIFKCKNNLYT